MFRKLLGLVWYLLVCGVFVALGSFARFAMRSPLFWGGIKAAVLGPPDPKQVFSSHAATFLILGCDEDLYYQGLTVLKHKARSDMMLVAKMDFDHNAITGVSIPRDTWCQLPGYPKHKINAYHAIAKWGQEDALTKEAVQHLIGVRIDKVITIDYDAFQKMVDLVGGVPVNVSKQMDYDDNAGNLHVHLSPGRHVLNGYDAMCYVRYRHSNKGMADTDFQRQDRQKDFLVGFKQSVFRHLTNAPEIAEASKSVLGGALTNEEILAVAFFSRAVPPQNIRLGVIPTVEEGRGLRLDAAKLPGVLAEYRLADTATRVSLLR